MQQLDLRSAIKVEVLYHKIRHHLCGAFLPLLLLSVPLALYLPGFPGSFHLDDIPNLQRLANDDTSLFAFLHNPAANGGTGRPLAYLSFYLQRASYPNRPEDFLTVNIAIHLFNIVLVYWLVNALAHVRKIAYPQRLALGVALLWGLLPIHVSTVLYIVQRMTLLAASFVLLGCTAYVQLRLYRLSIEHCTLLRLSLWVMVAYLGILAKENAILAGLALALLEYFFLYRKAPQPPRWWRWTLFFGPPLLVAFYLLAIKEIQNHYGGRDFNISERLTTEARVLWDYLRAILFPTLHDLGLFHDDFPISRNWGLHESAAVTGWILALASIWNRHWALWPLSFGLAWFLSMHSLESTIIPLEIYFEHRNYLPSVGIVAGIGFLFSPLLNRPIQSQKIWLLILAGFFYLIWIGSVTFIEARTWGNPRRFAAESFYKHPDSLRAMEALAGYFTDQGDFLRAYLLHLQWLKTHPGQYTPGLDLRMLMLSCYDTRISFEWNKKIEQRLRTGKYDHSLDVLQEIFRRLHAGQCSHLSKKEYINLIDSLLSNPRYHNMKTKCFLKKFKASTQLTMGKPRQALETVLQGMDLHNVDFDYLLLAATLAYEVNDTVRLRRIMSLVQKKRPYDFTLGKGQRDLLQRLERSISRSTAKLFTGT